MCNVHRWTGRCYFLRAYLKLGTSSRLCIPQWLCGTLCWNLCYNISSNKLITVARGLVRHNVYFVWSGWYIILNSCDKYTFRYTIFLIAVVNTVSQTTRSLRFLMLLKLYLLFLLEMSKCGSHKLLRTRPLLFQEFLYTVIVNHAIFHVSFKYFKFSSYLFIVEFCCKSWYCETALLFWTVWYLLWEFYPTFFCISSVINTYFTVIY